MYIHFADIAVIARAPHSPFPATPRPTSIRLSHERLAPLLICNFQRAAFPSSFIYEMRARNIGERAEINTVYYVHGVLRRRYRRGFSSYIIII